MSGRITLGDLAKLPNALMNEFERRQEEKAQVVANTLVNRITGRSLPVSPFGGNRYESNQASHTSNPKLSQYLDIDVYANRKKSNLV